tara:strand:+ start:2033 stop:2515 length:483 start_codon:yes stop_codon:yes gene_type:complete
MKIYQVRADWMERTPLGQNQPTKYADTRAEARQVARQMAQTASRNTSLDAWEEYVVFVRSCDVSERLGKGRRFVVALLNGEGVVEADEGILDAVRRKAAIIRCDGCGKASRAQQLTPSVEGNLCVPCFDDRILLDEEKMAATEAMISDPTIGLLAETATR